ncbi:MAG: hypothetical protein JXA99_08910 [Candidatus Lokiarchaeota archaeon]|nr:hypothetical protein [Candidatus Lokiarchaeota archaeon]
MEIKIQSSAIKNSVMFTKSEICPYLRLCKYCNSIQKKRCCLHHSVSNNDMIMCYNLECVNSHDCIDAIENILKPIQIPSIKDIISNNFTVKKPLLDLKTNFIPRIDLFSSKKRNEQIKIIERNNIPILAISLQNLLSSKKDQILKNNFNKDIHDIIDFNGKILLVTNISDHFCEKLLSNIDQYISALKILKPDIITTFDANFYLTQPIFITKYQLNQILIANNRIKDLNIYQIGLVPPVQVKYFEIILDRMLNNNYKVIGIPFLEINRDKKRKLKQNYIDILNKFKQKYDFKFILISTNPDKKIMSDCYISQSWVKIKNSRNLNLQEKIKLWDVRIKKNLKDSNESNKIKSIYQWM